MIVENLCHRRRLAQRRHASHVLAQFPGGGALPPSKIKLEALKHHLRAIKDLAEQEDAFLSSLSRLKPIDVFYEELLSAPDQAFGRIHTALGIHSMNRMRSRTRKNTPDDLRAAILNYDEVADFLKGTPFADFL